jgi:excisionase family DNA binding protein
MALWPRPTAQFWPASIALLTTWGLFRFQASMCVWGERWGVAMSETKNTSTLTVKEAAAELNCSISFVYKLMDLGELVYERRGRRKLPTTASIAEYRERNTVRASQRFDYPKKNAHEPYVYQQLFKKVTRKKREA